MQFILENTQKNPKKQKQQQQQQSEITFIMETEKRTVVIAYSKTEYTS